MLKSNTKDKSSVKSVDATEDTTTTDSQEGTVSESSSSSSSSNSEAKYVTVSSGQGIYRVAVNNGLTVDQLLQLNPGMGSNLNPGQQVRVK